MDLTLSRLTTLFSIYLVACPQQHQKPTSFPPFRPDPFSPSAFYATMAAKLFFQAASPHHT
jgi:hypothetical protein